MRFGNALLLAALAALLGLTLACKREERKDDPAVTAARVAAPEQAELPVVRLGNLKFAHYGAVSYLQEIGPKCGVKVQERMFAKGPDIMQDIIAGEIDDGASASEGAIAARANGTPIYVVAGFARGGARLLLRPDLGIKSVEGLKGKKVGVTRGGIHDVLLAAELGMHGLTWSDQGGKDVQILYLAYADLNQAPLQKQADAIRQSEPQSSQAIAKGFGVELLKPYDTPIGEPVRTLVMTEKFYKENRAGAEKFMRCFVTATKTFVEDKALASKYVRETMFKGQITPEDFDSAIANSPYGYDITVDHVQITADTMAKYGISKMAKPPIAADFVKLDLLEQAKTAAQVH